MFSPADLPEASMICSASKATKKRDGIGSICHSPVRMIVPQAIWSDID